MSITATRTGTITERPGTVTIGGHIGARVAGALLALAVASTHFADQGAAFPGTKEPGYVGVGYSIVEAVAVLAAILLLTRGARTGWFLSLGVALGPIIGDALSRGPGLPNYVDDKGAWFNEAVAIEAFAAEVLLLALAAFFLTRARARR